MQLEQLYRRLPAALQNVACSVEGLRINRRRYGRDYPACERAVMERDLRDPVYVQKLQLQRLAEHLRAAANSPYWAGQFAQYRVDVDGDPRDELCKLPIVSKQQVRAEALRIGNASLAEGLVACHTSGTTGAGLRFVETQAAERERWAVWWRYRGWHGIARDTWCGYFGGRSIVPVESSRAPYWRINRPGRQLMFSAYHLSPSTARSYLKALRRFSPPWLHGYPSFIALLAGLADTQRVPCTGVSLVTTGAENLLASQRAAIARAFRCPVRQHYGQAEAVANFSECEHGRLHVDEDFAYVEFLPHDAVENTYRVVGTNWSNPAFPLFRYDTGDVVQLGESGCPCGRIGRIVASIDGRQEDYVTLPGGARLGRLDHIFKDMVNVREAQIYQPSLSRIVLRIAKADDFNERDERLLLAEARQRIGNSLAIEVEYVQSIARTGSRKLRFVVSDVTRL